MEKTVRFRTVGDLTLTGCVESEADTIDEDHRGGRHRPGHRARRDPRRRPVLRGSHGGPQEGRLLLMADARSADGPAPLRHRRLGRRRQVHPDRAAAARLQVDLRGPAGGRRGHQPLARLRLHRPGPADRRPALRARAGHHHRRRLPLLRDPGPQVHHRRHPGPHPVHPQHGHRRLDRRPRPGAGRRPPGPDRADAAGTPCSCRCCGCPTWCWRSTRWTSSTTTQDDLRPDPRRVHALRDQAVDPRPRGHPDLGAQGRQRRDPLGEHALVPRPDADAPPRARARRLRPRPGRHPLPGAVRRTPEVRRVPRLPRLRRPGRRRRAEAGRRGRRPAQRHDLDDRRASTCSTRRSTRRSRRCRSPCASRTTSTSAAAT